MKPNQRTLILAGGLGIALLALVVVVPSDKRVFVVLILAILALVGLVGWNRMRDREGGADDAEWDEGGEWGLGSDEAQTDLVDLDERLAGFHQPSTPMFADDVEEEVWEEEEPVEEVTYAAGTFAEAARYDTAIDDELEEMVEEYADEEYAEEEPAEDEYAEEEYEEAEYAEDEYEAEPVSILAAPGVIDETHIDSDDAILAASKATSLQYDDVLSREDANAETREILSRVASLLAKYE